MSGDGRDAAADDHAEVELRQRLMEKAELVGYLGAVDALRAQGANLAFVAALVDDAAVQRHRFMLAKLQPPETRAQLASIRKNYASINAAIRQLAGLR